LYRPQYPQTEHISLEGRGDGRVTAVRYVGMCEGNCDIP
jgi:hypothetical protein